MALTATQIIMAREPNLSAALSGRIVALEPVVALYISADAMGDAYPLCVALLILHWFSLEAQSSGGSTIFNTGGAITGEDAGGLSRTYSADKASSSNTGGLAALDLTAYGKELQGIISSNVIPAMMAIKDDGADCGYNY